MSDLTQLLGASDAGDPQAAHQLLPLVYGELRKLAACKMAQEKPGQTLQATALVHEAWLRLAGSNRQQWRGRSHFLGAPIRKLSAWTSFPFGLPQRRSSSLSQLSETQSKLLSEL
jgi:hypothetical protein